MASPGKGARLKGHNFEREVANLLTENTNIPFKRGLGQARAGGSENADVYSPLLEDIHIECKRQIRCNIKEAIRQGKHDIKTSLQDRSLVVITKDDREEMLVTMPYRDWIVLFNLYVASRLEKGDTKSFDASIFTKEVSEEDHSS
jgi:hypothetical protein